MKEKKRDPRFFDHIFCRILAEKYKHLQRKVYHVFTAIRRNKSHLFTKISSTKSWPKQYWKIACFRYNTTENCILHTAIVNGNFIFTQECAFAERCCFLTFSFERKFRTYDISVKRKHRKTNENMIFSVLFKNFPQTKTPFFMQWFIWLCNGLNIFQQVDSNV